MKRDWSLLGDIFSAIENENIEEFIDGKNAEEKIKIYRHIEMLIDAGFIKGITLHYDVEDNISSYATYNPRITLQGYDFADVVMDKKLLNRTMNAIKKAGLLASFETIKAYAPVALKALVALA